jgi:hypothetical protein
MNFNTLFFPAPKDTNYTIVSHLGEVIYIPKRYELPPLQEDVDPDNQPLRIPKLIHKDSPTIDLVTVDL